jgi:hypothetical protein
MKTCSRCKEAKPFSEFHKWRASSDGLMPACKPCKNAAARLRYVEDEAYRESQKRATAARQKAEPEKHRAANRRHYENTKVEYIARVRRRDAAVPGYRLAASVWAKLKRKHRVPGWVKLADFLPIYAERAALGPGYELRHPAQQRGGLGAPHSG